MPVIKKTKSVINDDRHAALKFLNYINSIHPDIKFTIEKL